MELFWLIYYTTLSREQRGVFFLFIGKIFRVLCNILPFWQQKPGSFEPG